MKNAKLAYIKLNKETGTGTVSACFCNSLEGDQPEYFQFIKDTAATCLIEFWFLGYDHTNHVENGFSYTEMESRPYDELKRRFDLSEKLMKDKCGLTLNTYVPPGGGGLPPGVTSAPSPSGNTPPNPDIYKVMQDVPDMKVWLYNRPLDDLGKQLAAQGKVVILDRVWQVNIEQPIFKLNFAKFVEGYNKFPDRDYFVMQGHSGPGMRMAGRKSTKSSISSRRKTRRS